MEKNIENDFLIVLNFKAYEQSIGEKGKKLMHAIANNQKQGITIFAMPQTVDLKDFGKIDENILSQGADHCSPGSHTGSITIEALKSTGIKGIVINHSENQIVLDKIKHLVNRCKDEGLISIVCADTPDKAKEISEFNPDYIAVEPPELIGTGISLTEANPEIISNTLDKLKDYDGQVLCGAGVSKPEHVKTAKEMGTKGVLVASAFVKNTEPEQWLKDVLAII